MAKELAGGEIAMQIRTARKEEPKDFIVDLEYDYVDRLIGRHMEKDTVKNIVSYLEMKILEERADGIKLSVPPYRVDVQRPWDVVEDILRIYGYNNIDIPSTLNSTITVKGEAAEPRGRTTRRLWLQRSAEQLAYKNFILQRPQGKLR